MGSEIKSGLGIIAALLAFALVPLGVGCGLLYLRHAALRDTEAAKSWVKTPCEIETCEWTSSGGDGGPSLDLVYRYEVEGKEYRNDRIDLLIGSMGDDDIMEKRIYESFPKGARAVCYVDPNDPQNSVFDRDHASGATSRLWMLAFPFVCTGIGFTLMLLRVTVEAVFMNRVEETTGVPNTVTGQRDPPRSIPWHTQFAVLSGPRGSQVAWLFVVACTFVFILLDGPACWARLFDVIPADVRVEGKITDVNELDSREFQITVYQNFFEYEVDERKYTGDSYTRGRRFNVDETVEIECDSDDPANGTISGARPSEFSWWHSAVPLGVLVLLVFGLACMYKQNIRALWLMRTGLLARARRLQGHTASEQIEEQYATQASPFYFEHEQGYVQAKWYSPPNSRNRKWFRANKTIRVLYSPKKPKNNVILDEDLVRVTAGTRTALDNLSSSYAAPMGILAIVVLLYNAF
jgi:hypothetical protein